VKLGAENRKQTIAAAVLGVVLVLILAYQFLPSSSTNASTAAPAATVAPDGLSTSPAHNAAKRGANAGPAAKKVSSAQDLDPTLHLAQLEAAERITYEGSGRNIFVAQAETEIPKPLATGATDLAQMKKDPIYTPPAATPAPPIPLKFFGFASQPGEPKKVFLIKGDDTFIAGEGEIVDRRYKVVRIAPSSVEIQDVLVSGPPQNIPLTLGNPS
jgi:hypothetical protein